MIRAEDREVAATHTQRASPAIERPGKRWPLVDQAPVHVDRRERNRVARLAARLRSHERALSATEAFGPGVETGEFEGAALVLDDHSEVSLFEANEGLGLEFRMFFLANEGDMVALASSRHADFEEHCRERLGLGRVDVATPQSQSPALSLARRCLGDERFLRRVVELARRSGRFTVVPFMGSGVVWRVAACIAERAHVPVRVSAPPPRLTRRVNDKLWFLRRVEEVLGRSACPTTYSAFGPAALTGRVSALARRHPRVCVKLPDSAGSTGNLVLDSGNVLGLASAALRERLVSFIAKLGWKDRYPLAVEVWETPVLSSPSVQLWIPRPELGAPMVEGIFEQFVESPPGEFMGARPASLASPWRLRLAREAVLIGLLLQELNYFGRCSLDAILVGDDTGRDEDFRLHWIECNGRWGGTSLPMTLVNRLEGNWARRAFVTVQKRVRDPRPHCRHSFGEILRRLHDRLYLPMERRSGAVLLSPPRLEHGTGLDFVVIADDIAAAEREAQELIPLLS